MVKEYEALDYFPWLLSLLLLLIFPTLLFLPAFWCLYLPSYSFCSWKTFLRATVILDCLLWSPFTYISLSEPLFLSLSILIKCLFKGPRVFHHSSCIGSLRTLVVALYININSFHTWLTLLLWRWRSHFLLNWNVYQPAWCHSPDDGNHHFEAVRTSNLL